MISIVDLHFVDDHTISAIQVTHVETIRRTKYLSVSARCRYVIQDDAVLPVASEYVTSLIFQGNYPGICTLTCQYKCRCVIKLSKNRIWNDMGDSGIYYRFIPKS